LMSFAYLGQLFAPIVGLSSLIIRNKLIRCMRLQKR